MSFINGRFSRFIAALAMTGVLASPAMATPPVVSPQAAMPSSVKQASHRTIDVKVDRGFLVGQVLSIAGQPEADKELQLRANEVLVANAKTDARGRFAVPVNKTGVFRLDVCNQRFQIRAWQANVAPPTAGEGLLVISQGDSVRGQAGASMLVSWLSNPLVLGLVAASAIAVPIAVDELDDDDDNHNDSAADLPSAS